MFLVTALRRKGRRRRRLRGASCLATPWVGFSTRTCQTKKKPSRFWERSERDYSGSVQDVDNDNEFSLVWAKGGVGNTSDFNKNVVNLFALGLVKG